LTKGWFLQFAIDNFSRLAVCDTELLPIRDTILEKYPLPPPVKSHCLDILKTSIDNLEELVIVKKLIPLTSETNTDEVKKQINREKARRRRAGGGGASAGDSAEHNEPVKKSVKSKNRRNYGYDGCYNDESYDENFYIIESSSDGPPLLISFINESIFEGDPCSASYFFYSTLSVQPINADSDIKNLRAYRRYPDLPNHSFHKFSNSVQARNDGGS
jgi:hypothetical protein